MPPQTAAAPAGAPAAAEGQSGLGVRLLNILARREVLTCNSLW